MSDAGGYAEMPEPPRSAQSHAPAVQPAKPAAPPVGLDLAPGAVLRRAMEMADARLDSGAPPLDRRMLDQIAHELDIPADTVAAAIAEARAGVTASPSVLDRVVGPRLVWSRREVELGRDEVDHRVVQWLEVGHGLKTRRRNDGAVVGFKRSDIAAKMTRTVRNVQGKGQLGKVREVTAVAVHSADIDGDGIEESSVVMVADLADQRNEALLGGSAVAVGGAAAVGIAAVALSPFAFVALPIAAGAGLITSRLMLQSSSREMRHGVEETMDSVAHGQVPPGLFDTVSRSMKDSISRSWRRRRSSGNSPSRR